MSDIILSMIDPTMLKDIYPKPGSFKNRRLKDNSRNPYVGLSLINILPIALYMTFLSGVITILFNLYREIPGLDGFDKIKEFVIMSLVFWLILAWLMIKLTSKRLEKTQIDVNLFIVVYLLVFLPISQYIYSLSQHLNGQPDSVPFMALAMIANIIYIPIILFIMSNEKINIRLKLGMLIAAILVGSLLAGIRF
ncbi:hypothetical protein HGB24_03265 [Candidatus Saccharibacteria bacterium]|nr:hypothetical protein [Candidatus Saccharibacteria bacterium]